MLEKESEIRRESFTFALGIKCLGAVIHEGSFRAFVLFVQYILNLKGRFPETVPCVVQEYFNECLKYSFADSA